MIAMLVGGDGIREEEEEREEACYEDVSNPVGL